MPGEIIVLAFVVSSNTDDNCSLLFLEQEIMKSIKEHIYKYLRDKPDSKTFASFSHLALTIFIY